MSMKGLLKLRERFIEQVEVLNAQTQLPPQVKEENHSSRAPTAERLQGGVQAYEKAIRMVEDTMEEQNEEDLSLEKQLIFDCAMELLYGHEDLTNAQIGLRLLDILNYMDVNKLPVRSREQGIKS